MTPTRTRLSGALDRARHETDRLFALIRPDSFYERPIPERHRIIFYRGHMEAFDWNLVTRHAVELPSFHPTFDRLFAFGIDPPPGELPSDRPSEWPGQAEVERYNQRVRDEIDSRLESVPEQLVHVALEHRLMHAETLAYILHRLAYERKTPQAQPPVAPQPAPAQGMIDVPAGEATLGLRPGEAFGWDNEFDAHTVTVPAFRISRYKITNGEYLEFVHQGAPAPFFWTDCGGRWMLRGMFAEIALPLDWPVYVTQSEATAYANWRGKSLPTEPQFHRAAGLAGLPATGNFDFRRWDPVPVTDGANSGGPQQMHGNGWEWTSTVFGPFPGFQPFPFYANYSEPFFDGQHYVLKGASPRTAACFLRPSFRNWFRPSYPYIYATFRLVDN